MKKIAVVSSPKNYNWFQSQLTTNANNSIAQLGYKFVHVPNVKTAMPLARNITCFVNVLAADDSFTRDAHNYLIESGCREVSAKVFSSGSVQDISSALEGKKKKRA